MRDTLPRTDVRRHSGRHSYSSFSSMYGPSFGPARMNIRNAINLNLLRVSKYLF